MRTYRPPVPVFLLFGALLLAGCDSRPAREGPVNPLDPENPATLGNPYGLQGSYVEGSVSLKWNRLNLP
ncbi:MAG: hypothetical protein ABIH26_05870, partial [Candidatus Eisenbacteria bacterium]